jgi:tight adherence protein B
VDALLFPILTASAAGSLVYGLARLVAAAIDNEKRKLQQRLVSTRGGGRNVGGGASDVRRPITYQTQAVGVSGVLAQLPLLGGLHRRLLQAYPELSLARFLAISGGAWFFTFIVFSALLASFTIGLVAAAVGAYVPFLAVLQRRARRQRMLADQLPAALDFLARALKAGHSFSTGLQMMGEELPQPLAAEFRRCYDQHGLGQSLEEALKDMAERIDSTDFAFFVTAVLIQRQTGGDLGEVLRNISGMIRQRIRLQQHVKAKTAEGRFTGYILVAFPAVMFVLLASLNPQYAATLTRTTAGHKMLALACGLQLLGLWAIRRITMVKV